MTLWGEDLESFLSVLHDPSSVCTTVRGAAASEVLIQYAQNWVCHSEGLQLLKEELRLRFPKCCVRFFLYSPC